MKWRDFHIKHLENKIINLIHVIKKHCWCKGMPSLVGFILAFLENIHYHNILELLQRNDANGLDAEKFMHEAWLHMIKL